MGDFRRWTVASVKSGQLWAHRAHREYLRGSPKPFWAETKPNFQAATARGSAICSLCVASSGTFG